MLHIHMWKEDYFVKATEKALLDRAYLCRRHEVLFSADAGWWIKIKSEFGMNDVFEYVML